MPRMRRHQPVHTPHRDSIRAGGWDEILEYLANVVPIQSRGRTELTLSLPAYLAEEIELRQLHILRSGWDQDPVGRTP